METSDRAPAGNEASLTSEAKLVADAIRRVFWNEASGIFAENLLADGTVKGGSESDFFAHTQIWATLAGIAPDSRASISSAHVASIVVSLRFRRAPRRVAICATRRTEPTN